MLDALPKEIPVAVPTLELASMVAPKTEKLNKLNRTFAKLTAENEIPAAEVVP